MCKYCISCRRIACVLAFYQSILVLVAPFRQFFPFTAISGACSVKMLLQRSLAAQTCTIAHLKMLILLSLRPACQYIQVCTIFLLLVEVLDSIMLLRATNIWSQKKNPYSMVSCAHVFMSHLVSSVQQTEGKQKYHE